APVTSATADCRFQQGRAAATEPAPTGRLASGCPVGTEASTQLKPKPARLGKAVPVTASAATAAPEGNGNRRRHPPRLGMLAPGFGCDGSSSITRRPDQSARADEASNVFVTETARATTLETYAALPDPRCRAQRERAE